MHQRAQGARGSSPNTALPVLAAYQEAEDFKRRLFWVCKQFQSSKVIRDEGNQQSQEQEQGGDSASSHKPGTKQSEDSPLSRGLARGQDQMGKALSARSSGQHDQGGTTSSKRYHKMPSSTENVMQVISARKPHVSLQTRLALKYTFSKPDQGQRAA